MKLLSLLVVAALLLAGFAFSASVKDVCPDSNGRPDDFCISNNAQPAADCGAMSSNSVYAEECYKKVMSTVTDCSGIPNENARKECVLYKFYAQNRNNSGACSTIQPEYEEDCYIYFVVQKSPNDLDGCDSVPAGYQTDCQKQLLRGMLGFNPTNEYCSTLKPKYSDVCLQTVKEQKAFIGASAGILGVFLGIMGLFAASPFICCGGVVLILCVIAAAYYFRQKGDKGRKK